MHNKIVSKKYFCLLFPNLLSFASFLAAGNATKLGLQRATVFQYHRVYHFKRREAVRIQI